MTPRKKERIQTPKTITSPVEDDSTICSESEESSCPKSGVSKDDDNATC